MPRRTASTSFTDEEKAAMRARARELRSAADDGEAEVLAKIAEMNDADRDIAERLHALIKATAPSLSPRLWYGMPAYAKDGNLVCHFQPAQKFKTRYATLGFSDRAHLDDGGVWPVAYALKGLSAADAKRVTALITQAVS